MKKKTEEFDLEKQIGYHIINKNTILKRNKSSRTTFTLTKTTMNQIKILQKEYDYKIKEIFNSICHMFDENEFKGIGDVILEMSKKNDNSKSEDQINRSFAVDQKSVQVINKISKDNNVKRNSLINTSINAFFRLIKASEEKEFEDKQTALIKFKEYLKIIENFEFELGEEIGHKNVLTRAFGDVPIVLNNLIDELEDSIEKNRPFNEKY